MCQRKSERETLMLSTKDLLCHCMHICMCRMCVCVTERKRERAFDAVYYRSGL